MAKILVVDDQPHIQEFLSALLTRHGHEVSVLPNMEQALEAALGGAVDLVVLDLNMPGISGLSFLKQVRKARGKVSVIIYSSHLAEESESDLRKAGADGFLAKGTDVETLTGEIEKVLKAREQAPVAPPEQKPEQTILVVDDDSSIRELLERYFSRKKYRVLQAESGQRALELARSEKISLALLDVQMPVMDGLSTLKELLRINPSLGVVMVTADRDDDKVRGAMELGAHGYVVKPFDFLYLDLVVTSKLMNPAS